MINRIIEFSVKNKLIIGLLTIGLIGLGIYNFLKLPIDAVPDITNNQVQVITISPSLAPQEVEQFITFPVEVAMSNLQDLIEIRSISRFGLSVVTVVFKDKVGIHLARQLVGEQIKVAENEIPEGYGIPELMPITTGLGEIYQFVLTAKPGYEGAFNTMDIRTVQDWIVKRQLSGIPGIVEISSFGGSVKQYEVTVQPRNLVGMDVTLAEIFDAIEANNQNTGGSYIEKGPNAFYIRAEGLAQSVEDLESIMVKKVNGVPLFLRDVAEVKMGSPPRFGAMTKDGKGEVVGGITLMLKGANTNEVIGRVKERIALVEKMLPEGLQIEPYLDRSRLIKQTSHTVRDNLLEGGLIVIFILILLLGSYRSGLIVASVIPLSMLFAFIMMNMFGVTANLMSLGAIDFGLIVDGAVIIVEGIIYLIHTKYLGKTLTGKEMDQSVIEASNRVGRSATFGVIIILIVYLPILAFQGVEGKTFRPMAQTVSFALLGALILSLTYVPMISAIFLNKKISGKITFADRIIEFLNKGHAPVLALALKRKVLLLAILFGLFFISLLSFKRLGGEFLPTLEEGDLAAQMAIQPGSSLTQSIATTTEIEKILMENFPEVVTVVSKIGTAEIPTDPMAVEDADIMIILKDKKEWVSAKGREELAEKMKEAVSVIPGAALDFTQPIQLRFNELMTGVKADVAVKIYGEDMEALFKTATEMAAIIQQVEGAGDVRVEQVVGLPQMVVKYDRDKLAQYGLSIKEINRVIKTAFAGETAGVIFEGEKRFDLVIRLDEEFRKDIKSLERLRINRPGGELVLLSQVADIVVETGPMQISRDDTKRRITIGINVRNRDVESFVDEISGRIESQVKLPPGYYVTYGGQFENLQSAKRTSAIAVPIALLMIFILLYFAFNSLKQAVMIFSAIPLAVMGGIWSLAIRGMPFSISAGVGFIALFGIVVLNGIVLISYYNQLAAEGMSDVYERVRIGTKMRLRPVLLTASTDALGFLPMAISTAAGAEVQKPLATVVIGGLITATFLTLVALPAIYVLFEEWSGKLKTNGRQRNNRGITMVLILALAIFSGKSLNAQDQIVKTTLESAIQKGIENHPLMQNAELEISKYEELKKSSWRLEGIDLGAEYGQINSAVRDFKISINQSFHLPPELRADAEEKGKTVILKESEKELIRKSLEKEIKMAYSDWLLARADLHLAMEKDSLYGLLAGYALKEYELGNRSKVEAQVFAAVKVRMDQQKKLAESKIIDAYSRLRSLFCIGPDEVPGEGSPLVYEVKNPLLSDSLQTPMMRIAGDEYYLSISRWNREKKQRWPEVSLGYFNQSIDGFRNFSGVQGGLVLPVWFWSDKSRIEAAKMDVMISENRMRQVYFTENERIISLWKKYGIFFSNYINHREKLLPVSDELENSARVSYKAGEISYSGLILILEQVWNYGMEYRENIRELNNVVLELNSLID